MTKETTPDLIEFEEPKSELMQELRKLGVDNKITVPKLFIVGRRKYLLIYKGIISEGWSEEDFSYVAPSSFNRGEILNSFSKIELIFNEIIEAKIIGDAENGAIELLDLSEKVEFSQKINLLTSRWKLISEDTFELLHRLKEVRNLMAHSWYIEKIPYGKNQTLRGNFNKFQTDIKLAWYRLINAYSCLRPQNEFMEKIVK